MAKRTAFLFVMQNKFTVINPRISCDNISEEYWNLKKAIFISEDIFLPWRYNRKKKKVLPTLWRLSIYCVKTKNRATFKVATIRTSNLISHWSLTGNWTLHTMVYNIQNQCVSGFIRGAEFWITRKYNFWKTGCFRVQVRGGRHLLLWVPSKELLGPIIELGFF
jgi:hypothetical protein